MPIAQTASDGELERDHSIWPQQGFHALYKTAKIRHLCEHIVADQEISLHAVAHQFLSQFSAKNLTSASVGGIAPHKTARMTDRLSSRSLITSRYDSLILSERCEASDLDAMPVSEEAVV
jgi:hypothetical protein